MKPRPVEMSHQLSQVILVISNRREKIERTFSPMSMRLCFALRNTMDSTNVRTYASTT